MTKNLITGIGGFVASHLADYLLEMGEEVYGTYRWNEDLSKIEHLKDKITLIPMDLNDLRSCIDAMEFKPDYIFHLAAQSYVVYSFQAPASTIDTNCVGTVNLLEVIRTLKEQKEYDPIIHICSSSEVYGQVAPENVPIKEDCPFNPASPYAVSKVCEDMLGLQYWLSYGIKTIRTRMFTHTGPRRGDVFVVSNFAKQIIEIEKSKRDPVIKVGNLDSVRTFADVRDVVNAYWTLVCSCPPGEVYNIGGKITMTVGEMLEKLLSFASAKNTKIEVDKSRLRPSDVTLQIPCIDKFVSETGWQPAIDFDTTLHDTLNYWREKL